MHNQEVFFLSGGIVTAGLGIYDTMQVGFEILGELSCTELFLVYHSSDCNMVRWPSMFDGEKKIAE